jgi:hypothetical protein
VAAWVRRWWLAGAIVAVPVVASLLFMQSDPSSRVWDVALGTPLLAVAVRGLLALALPWAMFWYMLLIGWAPPAVALLAAAAGFTFLLGCGAAIRRTPPRVVAPRAGS